MKLLASFLALALAWLPAAQAKDPDVEMFDISQTVIKMALAEGVTWDAASEAMMSKAAELNMKLVGRQNVGKELQARGIPAQNLEIFQFCDPEDAMKMVAFNTIYAAYMPCRIALVEDSNKRNWLLMLNLDMIINAFSLPAELQAIAIGVNGEMLSILTAGATGSF
ncbi:MAG: DUF302 domain-containing protein [Chromatiaceae bacterium]|nr:DUF302 domain-containing protein [Chromatiaceae bacterium]